MQDYSALGRLREDDGKTSLSYVTLHLKNKVEQETEGRGSGD